MPLYRRMEPNAEIFEYKCVEFAEPLLYGELLKEPIELAPVGREFTIVGNEIRGFEDAKENLMNVKTLAAVAATVAC